MPSTCTAWLLLANRHYLLEEVERAAAAEANALIRHIDHRARPRSVKSQAVADAGVETCLHNTADARPPPDPDGGRTWWAHFESARINTELTIF